MRRALLLAAALLAALAVPSSAADRPSERRSLRFDFAGTDGMLLVAGEIRSDARHPGLFATVSTSGKDAFFADVLELDGRGDVTTFGATGGGQSLCALPVVCSLSSDGQTLSFSAAYSMQGGFRLSEYMVLEGAKVRVQTTKLGDWRISRTAGWTRVTNDQVSTAGLRTPAGDVEVDQAWSAMGGRRGSVAIAVPACDEAGAGLTVLSGGAAGPQRAACPTYPVAAVATRATTWQVSGVVAGLTANRTRLLVLAA